MIKRLLADKKIGLISAEDAATRSKKVNENKDESLNEVICEILEEIGAQIIEASKLGNFWTVYHLHVSESVGLEHYNKIKRVISEKLNTKGYEVNIERFVVRPTNKIPKRENKNYSSRIEISWLQKRGREDNATPS